jgi:hypothetical protein
MSDFSAQREQQRNRHKVDIFGRKINEEGALLTCSVMRELEV